jgi:hypothetical protein
VKCRENASVGQLIIRLQLHTPNHRKRELRKTREKAKKTRRQRTNEQKKPEEKTRKNH